jgi:phenylacetate-CoA ligase
MIWNPEAECAPTELRKRMQLASLKNIAEKVYTKIPYYKKKFDDAGVKPTDIHSLADIAKLPFTTKDDLRETYPLGLLAVPMEQIEEVHMSSGTTGKPVVDAYTRGDIDLWCEVMARTLSMAGGCKDDIVQNCYGYGLFTGGPGAHYGSRLMGATVLPMSSGNTQRQITVMKDFGSTMLTCTPSYALYVAEVLHEEGVDLKDIKLKAGCFGAEPWSENMRKEIEAKLGIKAYDIYGLTEIIGPGVSSECETQDGLHIQEDYFYPEIIDPVSGKVLPFGEKGELVFTTLTKEGTPLIRYRTRDITYLFDTPCSCGRTTLKMHRLFGRTDDMMIIRGVNVFPSQIEQVLIAIEGTDPQYQIILTRGESHLDEIEVMVEVQQKFFTDETKGLENLRTKIASEMKSKLGVQAKIKLVEPKTIERSLGKAKRVIDNRVI